MAGHIATAACTDWCTPARILGRVRAALEGIDLDPCSNAESLVEAEIANWIGPPEGTDGLVADWLPGGTVFVNPPFGTVHRHRETKLVVSAAEWKEVPPPERKNYDRFTLGDWVKKIVAEHERALCEVILLSPANVDTSVWHDLIFPTAHATCFLRGRVQFEGATQVAPMPIALSYWGEHEARFERVMDYEGRVLRLGGNRRKAA